MIPVVENRQVISNGGEGSSSFEISSKDAAHIMTILRDTLYSDKVLAVLREYGANAWDAQRSLGRGDKPIKVTLPTYSEPTLSIRDNGPGLSVDDVFEVYNKYGASTKRDSNAAVGMLGIGSKSGFAYSDSFTIVSWHGGKRATYVAVIDASEKGKVELFDVQDSEDPSETGVEIQIPVKPQDIPEFERKAQALFAYFEPQPDINCVLPEIPKGKEFEGLGRILESQDGRPMGGSRGFVAVMGCVPYRIQLGQLEGVSRHAGSVSAILWFDIGTLQVAASREELKYGDSTKKALAERINTIIDKYVEFLMDGIDKLTPWERRLRIRQINDMYLPTPGSYKDYNDTFINFDKNSDFSLKHLGYRGKIESHYGIPVRRETRLVFRNEKRNLNGYAIQSTDIIVEPTLDERKARLTLAQYLQKHRLEGIPMVNISTVPWTRPETGPRSPVDAARAKAQCLVLDPTKLGYDRKSERWNPVTRVPKDTDVYVVLEAYAAAGFTDFYETYVGDKALIESIGGKMPDVVGYRHTQAHPVERAKLKGKDYRVWRDTDFIALLMAQPGIAEAVANKVWASVSSYGIYSHHLNVLGVDHPISQYMAKAIKGRDDYRKVTHAAQQVVNRVFFSLKTNEPKEEWVKLQKTYPLLVAMGENNLSGFSATYANQWFDYIKLMDSIHQTASQASAEQKEEAA